LAGRNGIPDRTKVFACLEFFKFCIVNGCFTRYLKTVEINPALGSIQV